MGREIKTHRCGHGLNELIRFEAYDDPDDKTKSNYTYRLFIKVGTEWNTLADVKFHKGSLVKDPTLAEPHPQPGFPNGMSSEILLALLIDHLQGFQKGPFSCRENSIAITYLENSLMWLQKRTKDRTERGVEGRQLA